MSRIDVEVNINEDGIFDKFDALVDETVMLEIHDLFAKMCDPYVPFLEGPLSQTVEVTPKCVRYVQPYARRQYYGEDFNFTKDKHPQATALWDKVMMDEHGEEFVEQVKAILLRKANELYG